MKALQIDEKKAKKLFPTASAEFKEMLIDSFGEKHFKKNLFDYKTFESICTEMGIDSIEVLPYKKPINVRQEAANACVKLDIISEFLLDGVKLDWSNPNQHKWYPYFNNYSSGSGFRFNGTFCGWAGTIASGGARLCVDTDEKAKFLGTQFIDIWNKFLNPNK